MKPLHGGEGIVDKFFVKLGIDGAAAAAHLGKQGMFFGQDLALGVIRPLLAALVVHCGKGIFGENAVAAHHAHLLEHQHSSACLSGGHCSSQSGCASSHYGHIAVKRAKAR